MYTFVVMVFVAAAAVAFYQKDVSISSVCIIHTLIKPSVYNKYTIQVYKHKRCPSMVKLCKMFVVNSMMDQVVNIETSRCHHQQHPSSPLMTVMIQMWAKSVGYSFNSFSTPSRSFSQSFGLFLWIVLSWNSANETIEIYCAIKWLFSGIYYDGGEFYRKRFSIFFSI